MINNRSFFMIPYGKHYIDEDDMLMWFIGFDVVNPVKRLFVILVAVLVIPPLIT